MNEFYRCTHCDWLDTLEEAGQDGSLASQGALCPKCYSHIEPNEEEHAGSAT